MVPEHGETKMAHAVETMAYAGETPWHGLGVKVDEFQDVEHLIAAAGLDWQVKKVPLFTANGQTVERLYGLERDSDHKILTIVGKRYVPFQNKEVLDFFTDFAKATDITLETAGSLDGGRQVWGLAKLKHDFTLPGGDVVKGHILLSVPHIFGMSATGRFTSTRVVCANTLAQAMGNSSSRFTMGHHRAFDKEAALSAVGAANEQMLTFQRNAEVLTKIKLGAEDTLKLLGKIFQPGVDVTAESFKPNRKLAAILGAIEEAPGSDMDTARGTAWGILNGVTYVNTHMAGRNVDSRLNSNWFGDNAKTGSKVLEDLLQLAA
jgi:phage/plasmid-like protein (TIGR03299 family)